MYLRQLRKALDHREVRDLNEAVHYAEKVGRPLNATITIHPGLLDTYPEDAGRWVSSFLNKLRIWCERVGGYYAIWVRENYEGHRREHLHILLHVRDQKREALQAALIRWLPGSERVVHVGRPQFRRDRFGRRVNKALTYMLKQMTPQARVALDRKVFREMRDRHDGAPVAAVLGKRCGTSRSLNARTRLAAYEAPRVDLATVPTVRVPDPMVSGDADPSNGERTPSAKSA